MRSTPLDAGARAASVWRWAEVGIGRTRALDRALGKLPPNLAVLLRAMDAVQHGRRSELRRLADEVQEDNAPVAAVLRALSLPRESLDDVALPESTPVHLRDLVRGLVDWRRKSPARHRTALERRCRRLPLLEAVAFLLRRPPVNSGADRLTRWRKIDEISPRVRELWWVARARQIGVSDPLDAARKELGKLRLNWDFRFWPDLGPEHPRSRLTEWLRRGGPWREEFRGQVKAFERSPRTARVELLSAMLRRIEADVRGQDPTEALPAVETACRLARTLPSLADLANQLLGLELRLRWISEDRPSPVQLLWSLWRPLRAADPRERRAVARWLVQGGSGGAPRIVGEAVCFLVVHGEDREEQRKLMEQHHELISRRELLTELEADGRGLNREYVLGLWKTHRGHTSRALARALHCARSPEPEGATLAAILLREVASARAEDLRRQSPRRRLKAAVDALGSPALELDLVVGVLCSLARVVDPRTIPWLAGLRRSISEAHRDSDAVPSIASLIGCWLLDDERASREFQRYGRWLRQDADDANCLELVGRLCFRRQSLGHDKMLVAWTETLTRFLLRNGSDALARQVEGCCLEDVEVHDGLFLWYAEHQRKLGRDSAFERLMSPRVVRLLRSSEEFL